MVAAPSSVQLAVPPPEQRMLLRNVSWKDYLVLRDVLDGPGIRMTYLQGTLELMAPSPEHELWKKNVARLVELYAFVNQIELYAYGSTTFRKEMNERGCEPDECYLIGQTLRDYPQIVLEVIHSSPLLNKLEVYAAMAIDEVWVFKDRQFDIHGLDRSTLSYAAAAGSRLLPGLDFASVARFAVRADTPSALREFAAELRKN